MYACMTSSQSPPAPTKVALPASCGILVKEAQVLGGEGRVSGWVGECVSE